MGCGFITQISLLALLLTIAASLPGCICMGDYFEPNDEYENSDFLSQQQPLDRFPMGLVYQERAFSDEEFEQQSDEISTDFTDFSSRIGEMGEERLGESNENARGIFAYRTKSKRVYKTVPYGPDNHHGPPNHHHNGPPIHSFHHVPRPAPFIHGHHPPRRNHGHKKVPHYVKYWKQNKPHHPHHHHNHKPKKGWKMEKGNLWSRGYFLDLAGRLGDAIGYLPEYGNHDHHHDEHGKLKYKGITLHNGFFTEVI